MRKSLSVALLAFSIALICANLLAKRVHNFLRPQQQESYEETTFFPFSFTSQSNYIKVYDENEEGSEAPAEEIFKEEVKQNFVLEMPDAAEDGLQQPKEIVKPILKTELTEEEKQTVLNYLQNKKMQEFITEMSSVISQEDLEQENYLRIAFKPEVRSIFMKYAQDAEFREIAANVMKDKNVLELAKKIIQDNEVKK